MPEAWMNSPALIVGAWPTTVTRSRCPFTLRRRTQKPLSGLWKVTRSTRPPSASEAAARGLRPASAQPSLLGALLGISRFAMDLVTNDARRHLGEVSDQSLVERLELRPEDLAKKALGSLAPHAHPGQFDQRWSGAAAHCRRRHSHGGSNVPAHMPRPAA
jgi:hypothetical protein